MVLDQPAGAGGGPPTCQRCPEAGLDPVRSGHFIHALSYSLIPPPGSWQRPRVESHHGEETRGKGNPKEQEP